MKTKCATDYWGKNTIRRIREGYYSAVYFNRTKEMLHKDGVMTDVIMQIFQRQNGAVLCGMHEVTELLKIGTGYWRGTTWVNCWNRLRVFSLQEGDTVNAKDSVMHIRGPYVYFAHLESLYLGILARRTMVATNARRLVNAASGKPVICFADRFDHFINQEGDGYAARIGGVTGVCTQAHASWWGGVPAGTMPHALIAIHDGSTLKSAQLFVQHFPKVPLIVLVDYENDCIKTALTVARVLKQSLWAIRIDTSSDVVDVSQKKTSASARGVTTELVQDVRKALNQEGFSNVKMVVSGGFNQDKIRYFENRKTPVDIYGVGSWLLKGSYDFTADIVMVQNKRQAKVGRAYTPNNRFHLIS